MKLSTTLNSFVLAGLIAIPALAQDPDDKPIPTPKPVTTDGGKVIEADVKKAADTAADAAAEAVDGIKKVGPLQIGARLDGMVSLPNIDGKFHTAKDFLGNVTVVNFWSTKCPIMQSYEKKYTSIQEDYAKKGVNFFHVNANETNDEIADGTPKDAKSKPYQAIRNYLEKYKLDRHVLVDHKSAFADLLGAKTTPDVFVFDKSGTLLYRGLIDTDYDGKQGDKAQQHLRDAIDAVLAGEKPPVQATMPRGCAIKRAPKPMKEKAEKAAETGLERARDKK